MTHKNTILLIDDDTDIQDLIKSFFRTKNFDVLIYSDALKAFEDLIHEKVHCDVIVCDLMLPGLTGIQLTERLKSIGSEIPIILVTANRKVEVAVEAIAAGAYDFVVKPLHLPQLLVSVERALYLSQVKNQNSTLRGVVQLQSGVVNVEGVIGKSPGLKKVMDLVQRVAQSAANVLITGESGVGKEVIAKAIHNLGPRKKNPFIVINCSSIPENLLESELFGHTKGSFTGAIDKRIGLFEEADGGTLFLDEIGDLSFPLQAKLLRVLQEKKIKRIGENIFRNINVRVLSATHKNLRQEIIHKNFREDLYFRLNVIPIFIPPLRERREDILPLVEYFLKKFLALSGQSAKKFSKESLEYFLSHKWDGNVRELENAVERSLVLAETDTIQIEDVTLFKEEVVVQSSENEFKYMSEFDTKLLTVDELINKYVQYVLKLNNGVKDKTAKDLQIDRKTLYRRLREIDTTTQLQ
jgi:two-component system response regulator HydG